VTFNPTDRVVLSAVGRRTITETYGAPPEALDTIGVVVTNPYARHLPPELLQLAVDEFGHGEVFVRWSLDPDTACPMANDELELWAPSYARHPNGEYAIATRALDNGALGIVMPHVDTPEQARDIADHLKYPPVGHRSVAGGQAIFDFKPVKIADLIEAANAATLVIVMLETPTAIANAEKIAAVPGIDVLLIGTNDLAAEMGIPGDFGNERIAAAYETTIAACRKHGKYPGMAGVYSEDLLKRYVGMGMQLALAGNDVGFLMAAGTERAGKVREWAKKA